MPIEVWSESIWLIKLSNEPALSEDLTAAAERISSGDQRPDLILDCTALEQINSTNLSQLLRLRKMAIDRDSRLRLVSIPDSIWAVFLTTGLDKVFYFEADVATALAALQITPRDENGTSRDG